MWMVEPGFSLLKREVLKKGAGMNPVVLDWNWRVQYELRVFNVYTGGIVIEGRTEGGVDVFVLHNYMVYNYNV